MISDAEKFKEQDAQIRKNNEARNNLENYIYGVKNSFTSPENELNIPESSKEEINSLLNGAVTWLDNNLDVDNVEYEDKLKELEGQCTPILSQVNIQTPEVEIEELD